MTNFVEYENSNNGKIFLNIEELFLEWNIPLINGILTKDKYIKADINENNTLTFEETGFNENISLLEENCSSIGILNTLKHKNYTLYCGEGISHGSIGFIAIVNKNNKLVWLMSHELINPIEEMRVENNKIIGRNTYKREYEFEIDWEKLNMEWYF